MSTLANPRISAAVLDSLPVHDGYRAISSTRLMAAQADAQGLSFHLSGQAMPAVVVFSSIMLMPAVADELEGLAEQVFGASDLLGVTRSVSPLGLLGEEADIAVIDGSPAGLMRAALLEPAWKLALGVNDNLSEIDLFPVISAFMQRRARPASVELSPGQAHDSLLSKKS